MTRFQRRGFPDLHLDIIEPKIRERAYQLYQHRIAAEQPGDEITDWLIAEREVKTEIDTQLAKQNQTA